MITRIASLCALLTAAFLALAAPGWGLPSLSAGAQSSPDAYRSLDVTFGNRDVTLAGTLTLPESSGPHPAIVLLTGSGPQDRNEEVVPGFPIFALIADHLTRQGIAVLRYDDRGIGESTGSYAEASLYDFASDGKAAVAYLRTRPDIDRDQVGVLGHSEGGLYAAMIGADPSTRVAFIVSMAGPGADGAALLLRQNELILSQAGAPPEAIRLQIESLKAMFPLVAERDWDGVEEQVYEVALDQYEFLSEEVREAIGADAETFARAVAAALRESIEGEWFPTFLEYDPSLDWARTTVPVLALFGELDLQVDAEQNAAPLVQSLVRGRNHDFSLVVLPDANHLFQAALTGSLDEYAQLPPTFTSDFLPVVGDWLLRHIETPVIASEVAIAPPSTGDAGIR